MNKKKTVLIFILVLITCIVAVTVFWFTWALWGVEWFARYFHKRDNPIGIVELGQIGDLFGGFNALFSSFSALFAGFAFFGVAIAAYLQYHTLNLTREQHARQSFEPLFFQLLQQQRKISKEEKLDIPTGWTGVSMLRIGFEGYDISNAVVYLSREIGRQLNEASSIEDDAVTKSILLEPYEEFYQLNDEKLGPYFRLLYHTFKLVEQADINEEVRIEYANIARGMLGSAELFLLSVNCLSSYGSEFKPLVESYGLLKHARITTGSDLNLQAAIIDRFYKPTARMSAVERKTYLNTLPT